MDGPIIPEDPHDSDESDDLAGLADDLDVLELVQEERQVERDDGKQVNLIIRGEISERLDYTVIEKPIVLRYQVVKFSEHIE